MRTALLCVVTLLGACKHSQPTRAATTPLDLALVYKEMDLYGAPYPLSGQKEDTAGKALQVPMGTRVDVNSVLEIKVDKEALAKKLGQPDITEQANELEGRRAKVKSLMDGLSKVVTARTNAISSYRSSLGKPVESPEFKAFEKAKSDAGNAGKALRAGIRELWPVNEREAILETIVPDPSLSLLQERLQAEIDRLADDYRRLRQGVEQNGLSLRLEAFLHGKDSDPRPIHLDGYDKIDEQKLTTADRFGLNLSDRQLEILKTRMQDSIELARDANEARKQQMSLKDLFSKHTGEVGKKIQTAVDEVNSLRRALKERKIGDLAQAAKEAGQELVNFARAEVKDEFKNLPDAIVASSPGIQAILGMAEQFQQFRDAWHSASPLQLVQLVTTGMTLIQSLPTLPESLAGIPEDVESVVKKSLAEVLQSVELQAREKWTRDLRPKLEEYVTLALQAKQTLKAMQDALAEVQGIRDKILGNNFVPLATLTQAPDSQVIPFDKIKDTYLDLKRTARVPGDSITLRSTLYQGGKEIDQGTASFQVDRFGYYADWAPSVVLAKPNNAAPGESDDFQFAPSLSWMHRYSPRPEADSWYDPISRFLDPAIGVHATFLNMQVDTEIEIGLGFTASFWGDRLQGGIGYNLMADSGGGDAIYFFIGSSLIPLLHDVGLVTPNPAGVQ